MGPDLFVPDRFDARWYELGKDDLYYLGWTYFRKCRALTLNEAAVFNNVIDAASGS